MRAVAPALALLVALLAVVAAPLRPAQSSTAAPLPTATAPAGPTLLLLGPGNAEAPLVDLIDGAHERVLVEAFALVDPAVVAALQSAERRGVDVRVMLDAHGLNVKATLAQLNSAGIRTRVPNSAYPVTHLNEVVVDASVLAVATAALTSLNLGPQGPGYMVIDRDRRDVLQGASLFYDDWLRRPVNLFGDNLIILPDQASRLADLIAGAGVRVELYTSYLSDAGVVSALRDARARGVTIRLLTPRGSNNAVLPSLAQRSQVRFRNAGAGTLAIVDRRTVLVGSMDLSTATLANNRELGVVLSGQTVVSLADTAFFTQFARGSVLAPPTPRTQHGRTVVVGALKVAVTVSPVVRLGGQAVLVVATAPGASIGISITYPKGSKPSGAATGTSGHADAHGAFIYRWFVKGKVKTGAATAHLVVRGRGSVILYTAPFTIIQ